MEQFDFIEYMRAIAIALKDIAHVEDDETKKHFFRVTGIANMEEFLQNLTNADGYQLIVESIDDHTGNIFSQNTDNWLDAQTFVFFIVKGCAALDYDNIQDTMTGCKAVGYKVLSKIVKDWNDQSRGTITRTPLFTWDQRVNHSVVGPIGDNFYGIMYQLTFLPNVASKLVYNDTDWVTE